MTTLGPNAPSSAVNAGFGTPAWASPANAKVEDAALSTLTLAAQTGDALIFSGLAWSLPGGATISNILVEAKIKTSGPTITFQLQDSSFGIVALGLTCTSTTLAWQTLYSGTGGATLRSNIAANTDAYNFQVSTSATATFSVDAFRITLTYSLTGTTTTQTFDAALAKRFTTSHTFDAALATRTTKTHTLDAALATRTTKTHTWDASLNPSVPFLSHTWDALLAGTLTTTHSFDAALAARTLTSQTFDADLGLRTLATHTFDANIATPTQKTHTFDARLANYTDKTQTFDASLVPRVLKTHTWDALLFASDDGGGIGPPGVGYAPIGGPGASSADTIT